MTWAGEAGSQGSGLYLFTDDGSPDKVTGTSSEVLIWQAGLPKFVPQASLTGVEPVSIGQNSDVDVAGASPGDVLIFNGSSWTPSGLIINDLGDVDTVTSPPLVGEVLKWDGVNWTPSSDIAGSGVGAGDVTAALNLAANHVVVGDDGAKGVKTSTNITIDVLDNVSGVNTFALGGPLEPGYIASFRGPAAGNGIFIAAGENEGDILLHIEDQNGTLVFVEVHADDGQLVFGDTYANVLAATGVVYGFDNNWAGGPQTDYNTKNGVYRIAGDPLNINHLDDVDTTTSPPSVGEVLKWDGSNWTPSADIIGSGVGLGDVTAALSLAANRVVIGDDGAKGVKTSNVIITDEDETFFPGKTTVQSGNFLYEMNTATNMVTMSGASAPNEPIMKIYQEVDSGEFLYMYNHNENVALEFRQNLSGDGIFRIRENGGDPYFQVVDGQGIIRSFDSLITEPVSGYVFTVAGGDPGSGLMIMAGEQLGDIALHVSDSDDSFGGTGGAIMEVEADQGYVTFFKSYAQTFADNGVVYGIDQQGTGVTKDFNTQFGGYRVQGELVYDNDGNINTFAGSLSGTINGRRDFGVSAGNPVGVAPSAGDIYYDTSIEEEMRYDGTRAKWLSVTRIMDGAGRNGTTTAGTFYRRWNGMIESTTLGALVPKGTLVYLSLTSATAVTATLECLVGGSVVATLAHGGAVSASGNFNIDFNPGVMSFRNQAGGATTSSVQIVAHYKLRP